MRLRARALLTAGFLLSPGLVRAADRDCSAVVIEADTSFRRHFSELLGHLQSELSTGLSIDRCAHVALSLSDSDVIAVSVTLPDGRMASRIVTLPDELSPTLQALLLVPDSPPPAAISSDSGVANAPASEVANARRPPSSTPPPRREALPSRAPTERDPRHRALEGREFGIELSTLVGGRVGDGQVGYGGGVLSLVEIRSWLIGFQGRADGYRSMTGSDAETALELALLGGKRFDFGSVALDFMAGPALTMEGVTLSQTQASRVQSSTVNSPAAPAAHSPPSTDPVPRLVLGARVDFNSHAVFRGFVGIDGEMGPRQMSDGAEPVVASPHLPAFSVGLALGVTVGTR